MSRRALLALVLLQCAAALDNPLLRLLPKKRRDARLVDGILQAAREDRYYDMLQAKRSSSAAQLKEAYRGMAKRVHPDKNRDERAADAFTAVRDAYVTAPLLVLRLLLRRTLLLWRIASAASPVRHRRHYSDTN